MKYFISFCHIHMRNFIMFLTVYDCSETGNEYGVYNMYM